MERTKILFLNLIGKRLDFRVRLFNILALAGTIVSLIAGISCLFTNAGTANLAANLLVASLSFTLLCYSYKSGRYQLCYMITIILIFGVLFPVLFFSAGGYHSGMPSFFVFAVMFTVFMLEGPKAYVFALIEIALYVGICIFSYKNQSAVHFFETELNAVTDIIIGFVTVSLVMGITMYYHFKLYNDQQRQLMNQNETLGKINQLKTEFLANISHELKTPLTVISGYAQESEKNAVGDPAMSHNMKLISSEADRLALMVSQVLDVTRIDEGRMGFDIMPCSLTGIIQDALSTYYPVFSKNNNRITVARGSANLTVLCDAMRVSQVLVNLISNAARHTHDGKIEISVAEIDGFAEVRTSDTGEGIRQEDIETLFQRYKTHRKTVNTKNGHETGTGLGLYISKYIVEEQGGTIRIESKLNVGTIACFTLPLAKS